MFYSRITVKCVRLVGWCGVSDNADVPDCCGDGGAEAEGNPFNLLADLCLNPHQRHETLSAD